MAPGQVEAGPVPAWIGRNAFPYTLHLGHPTGPLPLSGIAGYAATIDGSPEAGPCETATICGAGEFELRGGLAEDSLTIPGLPEGTSYLHAVAVSGSGTQSRLPATSALHVDETDPVTRLSGQGSGWSNQPLKLTANATDEGSGMDAVSGGTTPFTAIRVDGDTPAIAAGDWVATTLIASGIHTVAYYARDAAGNVDDGGISGGRPDHEPATALVKIDRDPPQVAFAGAQDPLDPERIEARASDSLSGLDPDRGSIVVRPAGSGERFTALPTERSGTLLQARWDSESYPPGEYEFRATADDRAGNVTVATNRSDGSTMRLPSPLKIATSLAVEFRSRSIAYGRGAPFRGHLFAGRRTPLAGMPVEIIERFDAGAQPSERVTTVRTGPGSFGLHLAPGPSREVLAVAQPTASLRGTSSKPVRLGRAAARACGSPRRWRGSGGDRSSSAAGSPQTAHRSPPTARPCSSSSASRACPGASSARSTQIRGGAFATPTASPTTTAAACASSSGHSPRHKPAGPTQPAGSAPVTVRGA